MEDIRFQFSVVIPQFDFCQEKRTTGNFSSFGLDSNERSASEAVCAHWIPL